MASQPPVKAESVTHVSGTICHLCLEPLIPRQSNTFSPGKDRIKHNINTM